ncbi:MAG: hypothetical protein WCE54_22295 [Ignavibacteriaceae bacterium]
MMRLNRGSLFAAAISTLFLFLFFSSVSNAQSSSSLYNFNSQIYYPDVYFPQSDNSNIYTPTADQSDIYTLNQDLIDFHHSSLYESIHSAEGNDNNSLLIVLDNKGNVISVIRLKNGAEDQQQIYQDKQDKG